MRNSAISYLVLSVVTFAVFFGVQALVVPYFLPAPTIEVLDHPLEMTGIYTYFDGGRGSSDVRLNNMKFYCDASVGGGITCWESMHALARWSLITVKLVNLKTLFGHIALAMNIKSSSGAEIFSQTPVQVIESWKRWSFYWFSIISLILTVVVIIVVRGYFQAFHR